MTIHPEHPFRDPEGDPVRSLRGRLGGAVTLWTSGEKASVGSRAGLTVSSVMVAGGEPGRLLALIDPDSSLRDVLEETGRGVVHLLRWEHRDLAEAFAGQMPAPAARSRRGVGADRARPQAGHCPLLGHRRDRVVQLGGLVGPGRRTNGGRGGRRG